MAKLIAAKCPTCGAGLTVPPGATQLQCRYCGNTITVEMRKGPAPETGFPSRTLYLDPEVAAAAGKGVAAIMMVGLVVPLVAGAIGLVLTLRGGGAVPSIGGIRTATYPATCALNETIQLTGDWQGTGPVVTDVATNCRIKISKAHLKAAKLATAGVNTEITLEDVVLDTTAAAITAGTNTKIHVTGGSITSLAEVIESDGVNLEVTLASTTLTSIGANVIEGGANFSLVATGSTIKGRKNGAIRAENNAKLKTKATEIASMGAALKAKSNCTVDASGGQFTSDTSAAIDLDSNGNLALEGTTVRGRDAAVHATTSLKVRASAKATLLALSGNGIDGMSSFELYLDDASIEGSRAAANVTSSAHAKLLPGARLTGANGGLIAQSSLDLDATNATIEGGKGAAIQGTTSAEVKLHGGLVRGSPATWFTVKPSTLEVEGTKLEGGEKIGR